MVPAISPESIFTCSEIAALRCVLVTTVATATAIKTNRFIASSPRNRPLDSIRLPPAIRSLRAVRSMPTHERFLLHAGVVPFHRMAPIEQALVGSHQRRIVYQRRCDNESVGWILVETREIQCTHSRRSVERLLDHAGREHRI